MLTGGEECLIPKFIYTVLLMVMTLRGRRVEVAYVEVEVVIVLG